MQGVTLGSDAVAPAAAGARRRSATTCSSVRARRSSAPCEIGDRVPDRRQLGGRLVLRERRRDRGRACARRATTPADGADRAGLRAAGRRRRRARRPARAGPGRARATSRGARPAGLRARRARLAAPRGSAPLPLGRDYRHPHRDAAARRRALARALRAAARSACTPTPPRPACRAAGRPWRSRVPAVYTPHCLPFVGEMSRRAAALRPRRRARARAAHGGARLRVRGRAARRRWPARPAPRRLHVDPQRLPAAGPGRGARPGAARAARARPAGRRRQRAAAPEGASSVLLDAVPRMRARVPDARVAVVGDGPERAALRARGRAARRRGRLPAVHAAGRPPPARARRLRAALGVGGVPDRRARGAGVRRARRWPPTSAARARPWTPGDRRARPAARPRRAGRALAGAAARPGAARADGGRLAGAPRRALRGRAHAGGTAALYDAVLRARPAAARRRAGRRAARS